VKPLRNFEGDDDRVHEIAVGNLCHLLEKCPIILVKIQSKTNGENCEKYATLGDMLFIKMHFFLLVINTNPCAENADHVQKLMKQID